jgi:NUMOD4 motif/HNH endonuclease
MTESVTQLALPFDEPERWLPVVGWEDLYLVSDFGRVRSLPRIDSAGRTRAGRILSPNLSGVDRNYASVQLCRSGDQRRFKIHRMVLEAFVGPCPEGMECRHGPGGSLDNRLVNLSWGTHLDNIGPDRLRDGTLPYGERSGGAKLSADDVAAIRRRRAAGETGASLAREYGVRNSQISRIVTGARRARDGQPELARPAKRSKFTDEQVAEIRERYAAGGVFQSELAAEFGTHQSDISQIVLGKTYRRPPAS